MSDRIQVTAFRTSKLTVEEDDNDWLFTDSNGDQFPFSIDEIPDLVALATTIQEELENRRDAG